MATITSTLQYWNGTIGARTSTVNVNSDDTLVITIYSNNETWYSGTLSNCTRTPTQGSSGGTCTLSFSSSGAYTIRFAHQRWGWAWYYHTYNGTVTVVNPTLTAVDISPATATINDGDGSQAFTANPTGAANDIVYAWSLSGDTDNATLSSSSGNPVTVTTTNELDQSQETITITVSATSSAAGVSSGITDTATLTLNHATTPIGVLPLNNQEVGLIGEVQHIGAPPLNNQEVGLVGELETLGAKPREISRSSAPIQRW